VDRASILSIVAPYSNKPGLLSFRREGGSQEKSTSILSFFQLYVDWLTARKAIECSYFGGCDWMDKCHVTWSTAADRLPRFQQAPDQPPVHDHPQLYRAYSHLLPNRPSAPPSEVLFRHLSTPSATFRILTPPACALTSFVVTK
jgi:hypothetical protein